MSEHGELAAEDTVEGERPDIEALVVTYNSSSELPECLDAARAAGLEVAVLDNQSVDGTADLVAERYPWVRLVRASDNVGFGRGTNHLAETSSAEYLLLLNPDAIVSRDVPAKLVAVLADPEVVAAGPRLVYPNGERQPSNQIPPDLWFEAAQILGRTRLRRVGAWDAGREIDRVMRWSWRESNIPEDCDVLWATCWLMRARDVQEYGLFDERFPMYDEDLDYCARMRALGRRFVYVPGATVVHYGGASSTSAEKLRMTRVARERYYAMRRGRIYAMGFVGTCRLLNLVAGAFALARRGRHLFRGRTRHRRD